MTPDWPAVSLFAALVVVVFTVLAFTVSVTAAVIAAVGPVLLIGRFLLS